MEVQVNWWAVVVAAAASLVVGSFWFSKHLFADIWKKEVKLDDKKIKAGMGQGMVIAIVTALITAYVLAYLTFAVHKIMGGDFTADALKTAFMLWFGVAATTIFVQAGFEQRSVKLTALNLGYSLAGLLAMGLAIGWIGL